MDDRADKSTEARLMSLFDAPREWLNKADGADDTEHPPLSEIGCIEAWICYQQREEREDGAEVCGGCGRVLRPP